MIAIDFETTDITRSAEPCVMLVGSGVSSMDSTIPCRIPARVIYAEYEPTGGYITTDTVMFKSAWACSSDTYLYQKFHWGAAYIKKLLNADKSRETLLHIARTYQQVLPKTVVTCLARTTRRTLCSKSGFMNKKVRNRIKNK